MNKEEMIRIGKDLKQVSIREHQIKKRMDKCINTNGINPSRDTVDGIIQCCLLGDVKCQELINVLNSDDEIRNQAVNYLLAGYTGE